MFISKKVFQCQYRNCDSSSGHGMANYHGFGFFLGHKSISIRKNVREFLASPLPSDQKQIFEEPEPQVLIWKMETAP